MAKKNFSGRELDIIKLKMTGKGDKEIATELGISYWTVRHHIKKAFNKFKCSNVCQLIAHAHTGKI